MSDDDQRSSGAPSAEGEPIDSNDPALDTGPDDHPYRRVRPIQYVIALLVWLAISFTAATWANRWSHVDPRSWEAQLIAAPSILSLIGSFAVVRRHLGYVALVGVNVLAFGLAYLVAYFVRTV